MSTSSVFFLPAVASEQERLEELIRVSHGIPFAVRVVKRGIDIVMAILGLVVAAALFPFVMLAIRLDSPGPVFYRQKRAAGIGMQSRNGRRHFASFDMLKFRSMRIDAEKQTGAILARENDSRVTRVGRFLRKTRLDELPQFWNVLIGDMSLVGPRPERPELFENLALAIPFFEERMRDCRPGITGLAQVSLGYSGRAPSGSAVALMDNCLVNPFKLANADGSEADDMRTKLLFDLAYVASLEHFWTFIATELMIILKTPWVMMRGLGR
ncbi:MAG TPA: sugar transferase [Polyangiaceae bacterium]|jgi:lipopolysaccharide/colanic/teichoic acid biosynthesis glycosyltransferase|nr:sugar transferase [Polyangiaceae bacterium]